MAARPSPHRGDDVLSHPGSADRISVTTRRMIAASSTTNTHRATTLDLVFKRQAKHRCGWFQPVAGVRPTEHRQS